MCRCVCAASWLARFHDVDFVAKTFKERLAGLISTGLFLCGAEIEISFGVTHLIVRSLLVSSKAMSIV